MKLTKEECRDALNELFVYAKFIANKVEISSLLECYERLEQLINEHFDNDPLKEDEIELDIPYWDNKDKWWCSIVLDSAREKLKIVYMDTDYYIWYEFEPNRFYRKQVI